jgi:hypothetical protein
LLLLLASAQLPLPLVWAGLQLQLLAALRCCLLLWASPAVPCCGQLVRWRQQHKALLMQQ